MRRLTNQQIIDLLLGVNRQRGTTLVLVTHDPELAGVAHMTVALRDGRVVSQSSGTFGGASPIPNPGSRVPDPVQ